MIRRKLLLHLGRKSLDASSSSSFTFLGNVLAPGRLSLGNDQPEPCSLVHCGIRSEWRRRSSLLFGVEWAEGMYFMNTNMCSYDGGGEPKYECSHSAM